jgi:glycosyltransferase involved in cell wall biosynthesis
MNLGAAMANGTWIAPLDDDDEWEPDHLEVLLQAALGERAELAYGRLRGRHHEPPITIELGCWPPQLGDFGFQGALYNAALRDFRYDMACRFLGEPGDWNLARRMWEAGVRFTFVDRVVATWHVERGEEHWFRQRAVG